MTNFEIVDGHTFFVNCWRESIGSTNPAHVLMKSGPMFELAETIATNPKQWMIPQPTRVAFHQCSNPAISQSVWADLAWNVTMSRWDQAFSPAEEIL